jgi:hypothetical protein
VFRFFFRKVPIQTNWIVYHTSSEEFEDTNLLVPFFEEILPNDLDLSGGFFFLVRIYCYE